MTSFYVRSPSKFLIEYGWGGRNIDLGALAAGGTDAGTEPVGT